MEFTKLESAKFSSFFDFDRKSLLEADAICWGTRLRELRLQQKLALEASKKSYVAGVRRQVISMATGLGKTVLFANLREAHGFTKRVMILVHTDELAQQAVDKIKRWNPDHRVGLEMGNSYSEHRDVFVVASVQTLGRDKSPRINRFQPDDFDLVVTDECHHATSDSYKRIYNHFGFMDATCGDRLSVGVTATTRRADKRGLDECFDEIAFEYPLLSAIRDGWLCNLRGYRVRTTTDLDQVRSTNGDLNQNELSLAVNTPERNKLLVSEWLEHGEGRQTLAFTVDIQHAKDLAQSFRDADVMAEAVWGVDPERKAKLVRHGTKQTTVLCNAAMLIEGYDDWQIGCVINAKPTKSQSMYQQMAGRGTRLQDGVSNLLEAAEAGTDILKHDCILMDAADNTKRHSLASIGTLVGLPAKLSLNGLTVTQALEQVEEAKLSSPKVDFDDLEDLSQVKAYIEKVDLFRRPYAPEIMEHSALAWIKTPKGNYLLILPNREKIVVYKDYSQKWHVEGSIKGNSFEDLAHTFADAMDSADKLLRQFGKNLIAYVRRDKPAQYGKEPVGKEQIGKVADLLVKRGLPPMDIAHMTHPEACRLYIYISAGRYDHTRIQ